MGTLPYNFGSLSGQDTAQDWNDFLGAARALREALGPNAHLADRYITIMMDAANTSFSEGITADGFNAGSDLYGLCQGIVNGDNDHREHPFYETALTYITAHPLPGLERQTRAWTYFVPLFGKYLEYAAAKYALETEAKAQELTDVDKLDRLRVRIMAELDDQDALFETMLLKFKRCFVYASTMSAFLNGATYQLIEALSHCDQDTGRRVFQILLDHPLEFA